MPCGRFPLRIPPCVLRKGKRVAGAAPAGHVLPLVSSAHRTVFADWTTSLTKASLGGGSAMIRAEFDPGIGGCSFGTAVITHPNILWPVAEVIEDRSEDEGPREVAGPEACPNCQSPLDGAYCAACGQRNQPLRQPLHRFRW